jgi:hypothetical protein
MTEIQISRADIDDLAQKVDTIPLSPPPKALLSAIVAAIRDVTDDQAPTVTVTVDITAPLQAGFDTAFTPDQVQENAAAAPKVTVTVTKIGRGPT